MPYTELLVVWTGPSGLPGYSKFRFIGTLSTGQVDAAAANVKAFFLAMASRLPTAVTFAVQSGVSFHGDDGELTGESTIATLPTAVVGTASGTYSAASGYMVLWNTGAINGGKKVRGRTYFVPAATAIFDPDGTITEAARASILTAAQTFATSTPSPAINSRARPSNPGAGNQTVAVIGATVSDKQVVMRSRRD